jgi:aspartate aminotransferase-like enzyme
MERNFFERGVVMTNEKLLLIPGPSPVVPRILRALAQPTVSHVSREIAEEVAEACANLKKTVFCTNGEAFIVAGAGTLSMEMALVNTAAGGERVLVLSQGFFGNRMGEICRSFGYACDVIEAEWGRAVLPEELKDAVDKMDYRVVISTHVDTATGACAPVREYARVLKDRGLFFIVDGVCATGGIEERMDDWGIDVVLTAAQKCFGAPPGLAIVVAAERALEKRRGMKNIPAYYTDWLRWLPIMKDSTKYFSTHCVNEIRAFWESTRIVMEEGVERRFARHARFGRAIRAALRALGFTFFTQEPFIADTLSVVRYPQAVEDQPFRSLYYENGVVVAGGLAQTAGKVFRMGHMGNLTVEQIYFALEAMEKSLAALGYGFEMGTSLRAARAVLGE